MRYRYLVVDVDGTLVGGDSQPGPGTAEALRAVEAAGLRIGLSTGRTPAACAHLLTSLPLTGPHIFFDGSLVVDSASAHPLLAHHVDPSATQTVLEFAARHGLTAELYTRTGYHVAAVTPAVEAHAALQGCQPTVADLAQVLVTGGVVKAELVLATDEERALVRAFEPTLAGRLRFSWATAPGLPQLSFINVVAAGASKGSALTATAQALAVPLTSVVAIGDSANDIPMFSVAGLAIAMGDASEAVRRAAHVVTTPFAAGGLATALHQHVLNHQPASAD